MIVAKTTCSRIKCLLNEYTFILHYLHREFDLHRQRYADISDEEIDDLVKEISSS
jgi:hypothetical protein